MTPLVPVQSYDAPVPRPVPGRSTSKEPRDE